MANPAQHITATILGCGSSGGVPRVGGNWGVCDPDNPKNRRSRCSLLITGTTPGQQGATRIVIDTGCDLRTQLLATDVDEVAAVLYTHAHADHTHGIDDLRVLALNSQKRVDVYASKDTQKRLTKAFDYCFSAPPGSPYPPILSAHDIEAGENVVIEGPGGAIEVHAFAQEHGDIISLGFRIGNFAYSCDLSGIPSQSLKAVSDLDVWILDALRPTPHPSHLSLSDALQWIERMQPRQAVLTNLHIDLDYAETEKQTPAHVTPAFDGMVIDVSAGKVLR
jgi:phosphoribosyl 1,2-cyclic phosphate phosphodiesterase